MAEDSQGDSAKAIRVLCPPVSVRGSQGDMGRKAGEESRGPKGENCDKDQMKQLAYLQLHRKVNSCYNYWGQLTKTDDVEYF